MKGPLDIVTEEQAERLWALGYTITAVERRDPFFVDPEIIPDGKFYQWNPIETMFTSGWAPVPPNRHPGVFQPWSHSTLIRHGDLFLMEKAKEAADEARARDIDAARKLEAEWLDRVRAQGAVGGARIQRERAGEVAPVHEVGSFNDVKDATKLPRHLMGRVREVFDERDKLLAERETQHLPPATLADKEAATLAAIAIVEARIKEEDHGEAVHSAT